MNPYPQDRSIIVLDNCAIHKTHALREIVKGHGCLLMFLPPYSPDLNPIEESFSCGTYYYLFITHFVPLTIYLSVKAWIRHNWVHIQSHKYPEIALLESSQVITPEKSKEWFRHSGYNIM